MNFQNDRYTLKFAEPKDSEGIKAVYESGQFPGDLSIRFLRNPNPYASFLADAKKDGSRMMIIIDNEVNRVIAVGGAVIREEYVNGAIEPIAYMTGFKIHPDYQRKISFIPQSYRYLQEGLTECTHCYTTILDDNKAAIKMFEKKHRNMPTYHYLGHYTTYCFHGGANKVKLQTMTVDEVINAIRNRKESKLNQSIANCFDEMKKASFVPANLQQAGLGKRTFYYYVKEDEVVACCFIGDQTDYKQYEMCAYGGMYKWISKLPTHWFGYPKFPKEESIIHHGVVSFFYVKDGNEKLLKRFLKSAVKRSNYDLILWGCFETHPLKAAMDHYKTVHYGSRLYEVDWNEQGTPSYDQIGIEVALL